MGIETAAIVVAGIASAVSIASKIGEGVVQNTAAVQKEAALDLQEKQQTLQYQEKTLSNYDVMNKVIKAQEAQMTVRGTAFSSPSFNAIQRETLTIGAKKQKNLDIEDSIVQSNIELEKKNVRNTLFAQMFGDTVSVANTASNFATKMPSKLAQVEG